MTGTRTISRRRFFAISGTVAGGLVVAWSIPGCAATRSRRAFTPSGFVQIDPDGQITITAKNPDMGQGVKTSLPMYVAEELDADWASVRVVQADLNRDRYGGQGSGGSDNTPSEWQRLHEAGAIARALLVTAAAGRWGVDAAACETEPGFVVHRASEKRASFGSLATDAAQLPVPAKAPPLKDPSTYRLIGTGVRGVDVPAIVRGTPLYGIDVRIPGMLHAVIERCPVHGGRPAQVDSARALAVPGVRQVVTLTGLDNPTHLRPGVAVVADSTWAAEQGRKALAVTWDEGAGAAESSGHLLEQFRALEAGGGLKAIRTAGHVDSAWRAAATKVELTFQQPFLAHATLEPQNCTAHLRDGHCEIWGPLQMPTSGAPVIANAVGMPVEAVSIHITRLGGGFGRRLLSDYAAEAAVVSKLVAAPVQVIWSREDDIRHDYYRPAGFHHVRAGLDGRGSLSVWHHRLLTLSRNRYRQSTNGPEMTEIYGLLVPQSADPADTYDPDLVPTRIRNCRLEYGDFPTTVPTGAWRAPAHNFNAFVIESVLDELVHRGKVDPLMLRSGFLGDRPVIPKTDDASVPYDPRREQNVLRLALEKAGRQPLAMHWGRGWAAHYTFGSYAAVVAEVSVDGNRLAVERLVAALDVGLPVNPLTLEAQTQGGALDGLSAALFGEITIDRGRTVQSSFDGYRLLRNSEAPDVEVHITPSREKPMGYGEIALPPVAPAVANAIFRATGRRITRLPFAAAGFEIGAPRSYGL
ncbi:MAG TPA: molybdopterin cofactor-binding domain-containing protein [Gemmatimonadales bacterium]|nr:molybdopterin cofactor-binding domain-containing protein [Gemmatimonadales bacterium]